MPSLALILTLALAASIVSTQLATAAAQDVVADTEVTPITSADMTTIDESDDVDENQVMAPFLIRLHIIRHGETHANVANIVLGLGDSPLTDNGVAVATLAAASNLINGRQLRYWRTYCSDLYRAHRTAKIVLGLEDGDGNVIADSSDINLIVEPRLRELAKGAREGYLKELSYAEALAKRREEAGEKAVVTVPKLESLDDAWKRAQNWIDSLVNDTSAEYHNELEANDDLDNSASFSDDDPKVYDVFALSHSALIRTMIHKMVDDELPKDHATTREGSLSIPNLSRTIIDVRPYKEKYVSEMKNGRPRTPRWKPSLFRLTDVSHLSDATPNRPPYL